MGLMGQESKLNSADIVLHHVMRIKPEALDSVHVEFISKAHPIKSMDKAWQPTFADRLSKAYNTYPEVGECKDFERLLEDFDGDNKIYIVGVMSTHQCDGGRKAAETLLGSKAHVVRSSACQYLAEYGD